MTTIVDKSYETVRASVSFSQDMYAFLGEVAARKRVSIAWVVREAVESYIHALTGQQSERQVK
jgi:metal-responsive CopG/Arc/MetJ family transcriptional regulator